MIQCAGMYEGVRVDEEGKLAHLIQNQMALVIALTCPVTAIPMQSCPNVYLQIAPMASEFQLQKRRG